MLRSSLTDRKYALSPGPSPSLCLANGGPQARVSSPRSGCSTLITSALSNVSNLPNLFISASAWPAAIFRARPDHHGSAGLLFSVMRMRFTQDRRVSVCNMAVKPSVMRAAAAHQRDTYSCKHPGEIQDPVARQWQSYRGFACGSRGQSSPSCAT